MILHPLSLPVDLAAPSTVDTASLVSIINTTTGVVYITVADTVATRIGIAAGERVLLEKDYPLTIFATTDSAGTVATGVGEVLATKVAYAG